MNYSQIKTPILKRYLIYLKAINGDYLKQWYIISELFKREVSQLKQITNNYNN